MASGVYTHACMCTRTHTHTSTQTHTYILHESDFKKPGAWFKDKNPGVSFGHNMHLKTYIKNTQTIQYKKSYVIYLFLTLLSGVHCKTK